MSTTDLGYGAFFGKEFQSTHLINDLANKMHTLSENNDKARAIAWNMGLFDLCFAGLVGNIAYLGCKIILSPLEISVNAGARLTRHFMQESMEGKKRKIDKPGYATRRKICKALPDFIKNSNTFSHIGATILKIAKCVIAIFSSLLIGFISPEANLLFLHKIGLIEISQYSKEDRKKSILEAVGKFEGNFEKEQAERFEERVTKEGTLLLRKHVYGDNKFEGLDESDHHWDAEGLITKNLHAATEEKRKKSKKELKELKKEKGEKLTTEEFEQIKADYFDHIALYAQNKYKEYKSKAQPNFDKKDFEKHFKEYQKWNLTISEKDQIINETIEETNHSDNKDLASAKAEKELFNKHKRMRVRELTLELKLKEHEKRINDALSQLFEKLGKILAPLEELIKDKENKITVNQALELFGRLDKDFADGLTKLLESEQKRIRPDGRLTEIQRKEIVSAFIKLVKADAHHQTYQRIKAVLKAEETIITASEAENEILSPEQVAKIINDQGIPFTSDEKLQLAQFSVDALKISLKRLEELHIVLNKNSSVVSSNAIYEKKKMVMRELENEFPNSKFQRTKLPKPNETFHALNPSSVNAVLMQKALEESQAKLDVKLAEIEATQGLSPAQKTTRRNEVIKHYRTIEKDRIYERLYLEERFPTYLDRRKFKKSDQEPREVSFKALEEARQEAFKKLPYKKQGEKLTINTTVSRIEGVRKASSDQTSHFEALYDNRNTSHLAKEWAQVQVVFSDKIEETKVIFEKVPPKNEPEKKEEVPQNSEGTKKEAAEKKEEVRQWGRAPKHEYTFAELDALNEEMKQVHAEAVKKALYNRRTIEKVYGPKGTNATKEEVKRKLELRVVESVKDDEQREDAWAEVVNRLKTELSEEKNKQIEDSLKLQELA